MGEAPCEDGKAEQEMMPERAQEKDRKTLKGDRCVSSVQRRSEDGSRLHTVIMPAEKLVAHMEGQERLCREQCDMQGVKATSVNQDAVISENIPDSPALKSLLQGLLLSIETNVFVTVDLVRISRNVLEWCGIQFLLESSDVDFKFVTEEHK